MLRAALTPSTRHSYIQTWTGFSKFLRFSRMEDIEMAFTDLDIIRYVAHLFNQGFAHSLIQIQLSALSFWCKIKGWPLVTQSYPVGQALKGVRSLPVHPSLRKFPITPDIFSTLCRFVASLGLSLYVTLCLRAMYLLVYHAF